MKIGDYIRMDGRIGIVKDICKCLQCKERGFFEPQVLFNDNHDGLEYISCYWKDNLKFSPKVVELIEAGDYVVIDDRLQLVEKSLCGDYLFIKRITTDNEIRVTMLERLFYENTITGIITHEQQETNTYKIKL